MIKSEALFINGVYESALQEILQVQSVLPEQILFLQPYSGKSIAKLQNGSPTVEAPMRLFLSTTQDLATVRYEAEIVYWDDKRTMSEAKRRLVNDLLEKFQPNEGGLYNASRGESGKSVNLLHIRRLQLLSPPYSVEQLTKTSDGEPLSSNRTRAGGWAYIKLDRKHEGI